jgi:Uncharacterised protein family (UPF0149)
LDWDGRRALMTGAGRGIGLAFDHAPDGNIGLSNLDGFLTGIVVGPELNLPSEWLPVIWCFRLKLRCGPFSARSWDATTRSSLCIDTDPDDFDVEIDDVTDEDELMSHASVTTPTCIAGIHEFWRNYYEPSSRRGRSMSGGFHRRHH